MFYSEKKNTEARQEGSLNLPEQERREFLERFGEYLYEREYAENTIEKYNTDLRTFFRFLGEDPEVTKKRLVEYKKWMEEHYAPASANSMIAALNRFLDFAGAGGLKVKPFKIQRQIFSHEETKLTRQEYQSLLRTASALGKEQLALLLETIGGTGVRVSELRYFTAESVKLGRIEVKNKGKRRIILIPHPLRMKLIRYLKKQGIRKGEIFLTRKGSPKNRSNIWKEMKRLAGKAGVASEKVFPHNFRHFFACAFYKITGNLVKLADILGHESIEVTRCYAGSSVEECMKDMNALYQQTSQGLQNDSYVVYEIK